mmetsp:Transcript_8147/g.17846  ORF Transcript_8147/g.17846 Transcript_8147/m.17846 type:complete len:211 (-) Transcript_8147:163-795(-)
MLAHVAVSALSFSPSTSGLTSAVRTGRLAQSPMMATPEIKSDTGVTAPFGYFDPAGTMVNPAQLEQYPYYKEVEIKHGRVAMLAAPGFVIAEYFHPLFGGSIDTPSYLAFQQTPLQTFWPLVVAAIGAFEFSTSVPTFVEPKKGDDSTLWKLKPGRVAGDLGFFGGSKLAKEEPAKFREFQTKEINNGRLAMIAIAGMVGQELTTGSTLF